MQYLKQFSFSVDTHTVHKTTVVKQEVTDTNAIEGFVINFAKVYC